jgi:hypothetical protein
MTSIEIVIRTGVAGQISNHRLDFFRVANNKLRASRYIKNKLEIAPGGFVLV